MIKVDLKDAYLTVPIHAPHRKYLQFLWNGTNYQFKILPFGLSTAPRTFTKIMRPVMAKLREQGLRLIIYLDDILLMADSSEKLQYHTHILINLLQDLGFILNTKKCSLEPSQVIEFLSFLVDSRIMKLFLPQQKVDQIKKECRSMLKKGHSSARGLAHLIGLLTVTIHACLPAPLHYRGLQRLKHRALLTTQSYNQQVNLDMDAIKDLQFWITEIHKWNGRPINLPMADLTITSDASTSGWGASCGTSQTGGPWTVEEAQAHINLLELRAAFLALQTYASKLNNQHILLLIDNRTAIAYLNHKGGTISRAISNLAVEIWEWCLRRNLTVHAEHIPGKLNNRADAESRRNLDSSDWRLDSKVFSALMLKMLAISIYLLQDTMHN